MTKVKKLITGVLLGLFFIGLFSFSTLVFFVTDWWWFAEVGFTAILLKSLVAKVILGLVSAALAAIFLLSNFLWATRSLSTQAGKTLWLLKIPAQLTGQAFLLESTLIRKLGVVASLIIASIIGLTTAGNWQDILKFIDASPFGYADPIFGKDVGFYVFSLPVINFGLGLAKTLIILALVSSGLLYGLRGLINFQALTRRLGIPELEFAAEGETNLGARIHLGILAAFFFAATAVSSYLSLFGLLVAQSGPVFGAAFTDANILVLFLKVSVAVYSLSALLSVFWAVSGKIAPLLGAISLSVVVGFMAVIIPPLFQKLIVAPNELVKETPFIKNNIEATRRAFALDQIEEREIVAGKSLTAGDITANNLTVKNVRLWDRAPLLSTFSQIQEIRTYYEFASVDNDRYLLNGEPRQIMLSLRELSSASLPNRSFINERLTFTHGYGLAAGPVNEVTAEGLPVLFVKDLPPKTEFKELTVTQPEIYFGELSNDYVFVKTKAKEFDYPKGEENVYSTYGGKAGVEINSLLKRLFYTLRFGSLKLFLSNDITSESRVLYYRNVVERVKKIVPFLTLDRDPYAVVADGKIYWILDAYTTSDRYPYSQPLSLNGGAVNYIRNSVKIVVDAYNGDVAFYLNDPQDPIIKTYQRIFPGIFRPLSEMPQSLLPHLRYPEDIFTLQTSVYTVYHMDDPQVFYNKEDQWEIPSVPSEGEKPGSEATPLMTPRHMIMKLPGEKTEEYILMLPFTPRAKDNLSAWMVARNDGTNYGKLFVYRFPKDKLVFGPKQIIGRINQEAQISQQISLWDQRGSQVIQGPLLVIPIEESLLYVRPLYLKADTGKIPELKRVIVAYENKIAMEETLEAGLKRIFGADSGAASKPATGSMVNDPVRGPSSQELLKQAQAAYEKALRLQKDGDWAGYGEEIRALGEILRQIK